MTSLTFQAQRTKLIPFGVLKTLPVFQQCLGNQIRIFLHDTDTTFGLYRGGSNDNIRKFVEQMVSNLHDTTGLVSFFESCTTAEDDDDENNPEYQFAAQYYGFNLDAPDYDKEYRVIVVFFEHEQDLNQFLANALVIAKLSL